VATPASRGVEEPAPRPWASRSGTTPAPAAVSSCLRRNPSLPWRADGRAVATKSARARQSTKRFSSSFFCCLFPWYLLPVSFAPMPVNCFEKMGQRRVFTHLKPKDHRSGQPSEPRTVGARARLSRVHTPTTPPHALVHRPRVRWTTNLISAVGSIRPRPRRRASTSSVAAGFVRQCKLNRI